MADYPSAIPSFTSQANGGVGTPAYINDVTDELRAVALELGTLPKGAFSDVKARLDSLGSTPPANILINGDFQFWQRGTTFVTPASGVYNADRWRIDYNGAPTFSAERTQVVVDAPNPNAARINITAVGGATRLELTQLIEDFLKYRGKTISLQARIRANAAGKVKMRLSDGITATDSSIHSGGGTYETFTITKTISSVATNLILTIGIPSGGLAIVDIYISTVMMIVGSQSVAFVPQHPQSELARCQRYYEKSYNLAIDPASVTGDGAQFGRLTKSIASGALWGETTRFKVSKRTAPTVTLYSHTTGASAVVNIEGVDRGASAVILGENGFSTNNNTGGALGVLGDAIEYQWTADAEL